MKEEPETHVKMEPFVSDEELGSPAMEPELTIKEEEPEPESEPVKEEWEEEAPVSKYKEELEDSEDDVPLVRDCNCCLVGDYISSAEIIFCMRPANGRQRHNVTSSHWLGAYRKWSLPVH